MIIKDLFVSLTRACDDFRIDMASKGISSNLQFVNHDAKAVDAKLPETDTISLYQFQAETDTFTGCMVLLGISTYEDMSLLRHMELISHLYEKFCPDTRHKVIDATTGNPKGFMNVLDGTRLMPIGDDNGRTVQFVAISFATDAFRKPSP